MEQLDFVVEPNKDWLLIREILRRFEYNPVTGVVTHRIASNNKNTGAIAGYNVVRGHLTYLQVCVLNRYFLLHRVAWVLMRGEWPQGEIDHINRNGLDNRWSNLRDVPRSINGRNCRLQSNNSSGIAGVHWHKASNKWRIRIGASNDHNLIGYAETLEEAREMRLKAELEAGDYITDLTPVDALPPHLVDGESVELVSWFDVASHGLR